MNATEESKIRFLKNEVAAFESRLATVKAEVESLRKQKEVLAKDIEEAKERHNREVESKHISLRKSSSDVESLRKKLDEDRKEFQGILAQYQNDKNILEREKQAVLDIKELAQKTMDNVGGFIRMVRDGASKL